MYTHTHSNLVCMQASTYVCMIMHGRINRALFMPEITSQHITELIKNRQRAM